MAGGGAEVGERTEGGDCVPRREATSLEVAQLGAAVTVPVIGGDKCYHGADSRVGAGAQAYAWAIKI